VTVIAGFCYSMVKHNPFHNFADNNANHEMDGFLQHPKFATKFHKTVIFPSICTLSQYFLHLGAHLQLLLMLTYYMTDILEAKQSVKCRLTKPPLVLISQGLSSFAESNMEFSNSSFSRYMIHPVIAVQLSTAGAKLN